MIYAGEFSPTEQDQPAPGDIPGAAAPATSIDQPKAKKAKPDPTCIFHGKPMEAERLLRFVIGPEDVLYPDFTETLPGEAFYCTLYRSDLEKALAENIFSLAAGRAVTIPDTMLETIDRGLRHQALGMISMARKAGAMFTGAEKTENVLRSGKGRIYLTAAAKDADTREKLTHVANAANARIVDMFTSEELSKASGANKVFHAAMTRGGVTDRFFTHVKRMNLFRPQANSE